MVTSPLARAARARWYRDSRVPQVSGNMLGGSDFQQWLKS
jgi:hypothetical protein